MIEPATTAHLVRALEDLAEQARAVAWRADRSLATYPQVSTRLRAIAHELDRGAEVARVATP
jgi:hypothetical protein